jgi:carboxysome shell carbonic anhydrase
MPRRPALPPRSMAPTAPRRRPTPADAVPAAGQPLRRPAPGGWPRDRHPLTDGAANELLQRYDERTKQAFDRIVPVLKELSAQQHEADFVARAQAIAERELGVQLPLPLLENAWVTQLDMRTLFAWCVFETYQQVSTGFFRDHPLAARDSEGFQQFLLDCGFHLLDITPCADGRLAHAIAYALRIPTSCVRRRPHAGALFDVENTVDRWVKTEHRRYREAVPNEAHAPTRYLKVVVYHFSSLDPGHEGCAAHGSDDAAARRAGMERLDAFRQAVENSFCCGASVDLLLLGLDTDTDTLRVHVPDRDGRVELDQWLDAGELYGATAGLSAEAARAALLERVTAAAPGPVDGGMARLLARLIENNFSQIDYVRWFHGGAYSDAGHAERFIGVGIGFKEIHLRNLTYFAHLDTVEEGSDDLDVGIRIFRGLNVSRGLPIPVVVRFDYRGTVPGARERAIEHGERVMEALRLRYADLASMGLLFLLLSVRDRDRDVPAETVRSTITFAPTGGH